MACACKYNLMLRGKEAHASRSGLKNPSIIDTENCQALEIRDVTGSSIYWLSDKTSFPRREMRCIVQNGDCIVIVWGKVHRASLQECKPSFT